MTTDFYIEYLFERRDEFFLSLAPPYLNAGENLGTYPHG